MQAVRKPRNVIIDGKRTSMRLEAGYWEALVEIAQRERLSVSQLVTQLAKRQGAISAGSLSSAVRVYVMAYYRSATTEAGHAQAGHGAGDPLFDMV